MRIKMNKYVYSLILSLAALNMPIVNCSDDLFGSSEEPEEYAAPSHVRKKALSPKEKQDLFDAGAKIRAVRAAAKAKLKAQLKGSLWETEDSNDPAKIETQDYSSHNPDDSGNEDILDTLEKAIKPEESGKSVKLRQRKKFKEDEPTNKARRKFKQEEKKLTLKIRKARANKGSFTETE